MKLTEFRELLRQTKRRRWRVAEPPGNPWIRCGGVLGSCPIEAVYEAKTGLQSIGYISAARALGLSPALRRRIVNAADKEGRDDSLRAQLLADVGLAEVTE